MRKLEGSRHKFIKHKNYVITALKNDGSAQDAPDSFAISPKPLYFSGEDLLLAGFKTPRDFLSSAKCPFKIGTPVHFYEVVYADGEEKENTFHNFFIGSPLPHNIGLNDGAVSSDKGSPIIHNILPSKYSNEPEKMLYKTQNEQIAYFQKSLMEERKNFQNERLIYTQKIEDLNNNILELNLQINTLKAELEALRIRYEESSKYADVLKNLAESNDRVEEQQGLADKGVAFIDGMLGDGASVNLLSGLASGLGKGVDKLIDLGVDYIRSKGVIKGSEPSQASQPQQPQQQQIDPVLLEQLLKQHQEKAIIDKYNEELNG